MSPSLTPATLQIPRVRCPQPALGSCAHARGCSRVAGGTLLVGQASSQMTLESDGSFADRGGAPREARGMHAGRFPSDGAFDLSYLGAAGSSDGALSRQLTSMSGSTQVSAESLDEAQVAAQADFAQYDRRVFNPVRTGQAAPISTIVVRLLGMRACVCASWLAAVLTPTLVLGAQSNGAAEPMPRGLAAFARPELGGGLQWEVR